MLFVGGAGTGKTQVIKDYLATTKPEQVAYKTINFSSFTDVSALQKNIESVLDKKSGKAYGSAMNKTLIAFIDDLNMPYVDKYGTQSPIASKLCAWSVNIVIFNRIYKKVRPLQ